MMIVQHPELFREVLYWYELPTRREDGAPLVMRSEDPSPIPACVVCGVEWEASHTVGSMYGPYGVQSPAIHAFLWVFAPRCSCWKRGVEP